MSKVKFILLFLGVSFTISLASRAQDGEKTFKTTCSACHSIGKGKIVGPDLKDVDKRHDEAWLQKWIKSSQALVKSGDAAAVKLFADNSNVIMPDQVLSPEEIKSVIGYIKNKSTEAAAPKVAVTAPAAGAGSDEPRDKGNSLVGTFGFGGYLVVMLSGLFLIVIWVMSLMIKKFSLDLKEERYSTNH